MINKAIMGAWPGSNVMKIDINKNFLCFMSFFLVAAAPEGQNDHKKGQLPASASCHHWIKTVDRNGLDSTAEPLTLEVYCEKPDKIIVDRKSPVYDDYSGSGSTRRTRYRSGRQRYGRR